MWSVMVGSGGGGIMEVLLVSPSRREHAGSCHEAMRGQFSNISFGTEEKALSFISFFSLNREYFQMALKYIKEYVGGTSTLSLSHLPP
jgi:hypothetical protein